tara:strand:- start:1434 stop:1544 length:111 start_codon:yes stop_codon:yes gene_type:complete
MGIDKAIGTPVEVCGIGVYGDFVPGCPIHLALKKEA